MFRVWNGGKRSKYVQVDWHVLPTQVDDLRVIAYNEVKKSEDRFLNLIRGWHEKLLDWKPTGERKCSFAMIKQRQTIRSQGGSETRRERWGKEREMERENEDEIVCMRHSTSPDQFSCNVPQSDTALRGILQGPVPYAFSRACHTFRLIYLNGTCFKNRCTCMLP